MEPVFWAIDWCYSMGISIRKARRFNDREKVGLAEWYQKSGMVALDEPAIDLPYLTFRDLPDRQADGEFGGFGNQAYIITEDDVQHYVQINAAREKEAKRKEISDQRDHCLRIIEAAGKQEKLYTAAEAKARRQSWINVYNEGGEGYVPHFYTIDEVEEAKRWLNAHQEDDSHAD